MGEANFYYFTCLKDLFHVFCNVVTLKTIKMSADLYWMVVRDTSSFMMKGRLSKSKIFTKEPMNLTGLHSLTSSGTVGTKAVGVAEERSSRRHQVGRQQRLRFQQDQEARRHEESLRHSAQPKAKSRQEDEEGLNAKKKNSRG